MPAVNESSESCSALQAYKAFAFRNGVLMGDESLDVDEVGIGLDGAENMGQEGERGEVGLGFGGLQDITTRKLISTQGNHNRSMGGSWKAR